MIFDYSNSYVARPGEGSVALWGHEIGQVFAEPLGCPAGERERVPHSGRVNVISLHV